MLAKPTDIISSRVLSVAGIVPDYWYSHSSVVWPALAAWTKITHLSDPAQLATVLAVTYEPGVSVDAGAANAAAGTLSATRDGSFQGLGGYESENGSLLMMQAFPYGIFALLIVAFLTVWTVQRTRDIAVLKAMGASGRYLLRDALTQATLVLVAGAGLGGLLAVAATLIKPSSGLVMIDGVDSTALTEKELATLRRTLRRDKVGIMFQQPNLLASLTAAEQLVITDHLRGVSLRTATGQHCPRPHGTAQDITG